jgi:large subunit ribosomal protein L18
MCFHERLTEQRAIERKTRVTALADKVKARQRRRRGVRKRLFGTAERPRLSVFRSERHIYAQIVDDSAARTLTAASTRDPQLRARVPRGSNRDAAREVGKALAERARAAGLSKVVFDRGGYLYHGRIAALADGAREGGLEL